MTQENTALDIQGLQVCFPGGLAAVDGVDQLFRETGVRVPLASFGMTDGDAELVADNLPGFLLANNPRTVSKAQCIALYKDILVRETGN